MYYEIYRWAPHYQHDFSYWQFFRSCDTLEEAVYVQQLLEYRNGWATQIKAISCEC